MNDSMGDRFKRYENVSDGFLVRRTPVIARIDGKAFHTLTRGCQRPFDGNFARAMAAARLCEEVQGCKLAYWQSDEISLLLCDYDTIQTEAWFDYRLQKLCSIGASIAAVAFTQAFGKEAHFDARFFNVPENDVVNYFVWRQKDAERNSLQMLAQAHFSPKELHGKKREDLHELLHSKGVNWNDCDTIQKRGACLVRDEYGWRVDPAVPIFSQTREYIQRLLPVTV